jgi:hypothetical protein
MIKKSSRVYFICSVISLIAGIFFLIAAAILHFYGTSKLNEVIKNEIRFKNDSSFSKSRTLSLRKYYFYEVLNSDDLSSGKYKIPKLRERGPYVYDHVTSKRILEFSEDETNLTYTNSYMLFFRNDLSIGSENDSFMFLNLPLLAAVDQIESGKFELNPFILNILNLQLNENTNVFINLTVSDLINGYSDFLIETINQYKPGLLTGGKFSLLNGVTTLN